MCCESVQTPKPRVIGAVNVQHMKPIFIIYGPATLSHTRTDTQTAADEQVFT